MRKNEAELSEQWKLTCPNHILEYDVSDRITNSKIEPVMMSEEDNKKYRQLVHEGFDGSSYHDFRLQNDISKSTEI